MRYLRQSDNQRVIVPETSVLGVGGEARVYGVPSERGVAAKIYHRPSETQARKLRVMIANAPDDPMAAQEHISIAWPSDLLRKMYGDQSFAGFIMPRVAGMRPLFNIYNPVTRRQECPLFNYLYLHRAARNVAAAVRALHSRGYVIGDVNESNILVTETALVTLVDTDSFQVPDAQNHIVYRCPVGKPEFTPPELQGRNFRLVDRSPESDCFGLAVLIFQMLMEGAHPFSGIYQGDDDPPAYEARIREGHFTYGTKPVPYRPMPLAPSIEILHPGLRTLFVRCFEEGHADPQRRPDAAAWSSALLQAEENLVVCTQNAQHRYGNHLAACPWCLRKNLLGGRDPFPLQPAKPYVRPGRDERRVEQSTVVPGNAPQNAPAGAANSGTSPTLIRVSTAPKATHASSAGLPNWPLAPSVYGASVHSSTLRSPLPNYPMATWVASIFCVLALLIPGFHLAFGLLTIGSGLIGLRSAGSGRWLAGAASGLGALVSIFILAGVVQRTFVPADLRTLEEKGPVRAVAFTPDSRSIAVATERNEDQRLISGEAAVFDTQTGDLVKTFIYPGDVASVTYSRDGRLLAVGSGALLEAGSVRIWDTQTWRTRLVLTDFKSDVESVAFSPDGTRVVTGSRDRSVEIWDSASGALIQHMDGQGEVFSVAYSPDGSLVAAGSGSSGSGMPGRITVWDAQTGQLLWTKKGHSERCLSVAFSSHGNILGSAGNDNTIRLWNPRTGRLERMLEVTGVLRVCSVSFSPDGTLVACGGSDGLARVWDLTKGSVVRTFAGQGATVGTVAFSANGKLLACGSQNGVINLWRIH